MGVICGVFVLLSCGFEVNDYRALEAKNFGGICGLLGSMMRVKVRYEIRLA